MNATHLFRKGMERIFLVRGISLNSFLFGAYSMTIFLRIRCPGCSMFLVNTKRLSCRWEECVSLEMALLCIIAFSLISNKRALGPAEC